MYVYVCMCVRVCVCDTGGNDWMRQEMDVHNRQRLEKAAEALQAWSLNDRNNSPAPGGSPHGSDASMGNYFSKVSLYSEFIQEI